MKCTNEKMTWNTEDTNLSWYVPKANVDHTISGQGTAVSTLSHLATTTRMSIRFTLICFAVSIKLTTMFFTIYKHNTGSVSRFLAYSPGLGCGNYMQISIDSTSYRMLELPRMKLHSPLGFRICCFLSSY